jgi:hypothetical protein
LNQNERPHETPPTRWGFVVFGLVTCCLAGSPACALRPPEDAIACATEAAQEGDREAYTACFTKRSRSFLFTYWDSAGGVRPELLNLDVTDVRVLEVRGLAPQGMGPERALALLREGPRELRVVLHQEAGRWRIDLWDTRQAQFGLRGM